MIDTGISDLTPSTKKSKARAGKSSAESKQKNNNQGNPRSKNTNSASTVPSLKGTNVGLRGRVFVKGPLQVGKYNEAYITIIAYIGSNYDYRVYKTF